MSTNDTEYLLTLKPEDSLNVMATNANKLKYPLHGLKAGMPQAKGGQRTQVKLTARDRVAKDDFYPYEGEVDFNFNRLDLGAYFGGQLEGFRLALPSSTKELTDELTRRFGVEFTVDDVVYEAIGRSNSNPYTLKAKVESLRWTGQVQFVVADVRDLSTLFGAINTLDIPAYTKLTAELPLAAPYGNVQPIADEVAGIWPGTVAQNQPAIVSVFNKAMAPLSVHVRTGAANQWRVSATPGPFNLYGAKLVSVDAGIAQNPALANPNLNRVYEFELDLNYCTNVSDSRALLWYSDRIAELTQIRTTSRLTQAGVLNVTDGSAYADWLSTLTVTQSIGNSPYPQMDLEPNGRWYVSSTPYDNNLYGAIVQYNGPRRPQDNNSAVDGMTHVLVVTMNERYSTQWRGNIAIYYRMA